MCILEVCGVTFTSLVKNLASTSFSRELLDFEQMPLIFLIGSILYGTLVTLTTSAILVGLFRVVVSLAKQINIHTGWKKIFFIQWSILMTVWLLWLAFDVHYLLTAK